MRPTRFLRDPEYALRLVFVTVLGVGSSDLLRNKLRVLFLESVGNVLEEDQTEDDVLVLGRVHIGSELVCRGPELRFEAKVGTPVAPRFSLTLRWSRHVYS